MCVDESHFVDVHHLATAPLRSGFLADEIDKLPVSVRTESVRLRQRGWRGCAIDRRGLRQRSSNRARTADCLGGCFHVERAETLLSSDGDDTGGEFGINVMMHLNRFLKIRERSHAREMAVLSRTSTVAGLRQTSSLRGADPSVFDMVVQAGEFPFGKVPQDSD